MMLKIAAAFVAFLHFVVNASATSSTRLDVCVDEYSECFDDDLCFDCLHALVYDEGLYVECLDTFDEDLGDVCDSGLVITACCMDLVSPNDCLGNDLFVGYFQCDGEFQRESECNFTCDGVTVESDVAVSDGSVDEEVFDENGTIGFGPSSLGMLLSVLVVKIVTL